MNLEHDTKELIARYLGKRPAGVNVKWWNKALSRLEEVELFARRACENLPPEYTTADASCICKEGKMYDPNCLLHGLA